MAMTLISIEEAWSRMTACARPLPVERRRVDEALNLVLAEPVVAPMDLPPFDNSAMDGYALRAEETQGAADAEPIKLTIAGEIAAGSWQDTVVQPGTAIKIMTGAPLPPSTDTVLQLEAGRLRDGAVEVREPLPVGRHVRRCGEDVRRGQVLLGAGLRLNAQRLGLLANSGISDVAAIRRPRVSLLATGSELVTAGQPLAPGQIYDSNRIVLRTLVAQAGCDCDDFGLVRDDPSEIAARLKEAMAADLVLISGGVSVGSHDYVKPVLRELGMETLFWRVNAKPGKPLLCGRRQQTWVFGLPGNPISCVVGFLMFIEPLIRLLQGETNTQPRYAKATLMQPVSKKDGRRTFMTARLDTRPDGMLEVTPTEQQGSAMMQALAQADAFIVVPEDRPSMEAGEVVHVLRFNA